MLRILSLIIAILVFGGSVIMIVGYKTPASYEQTMTFRLPYSVDMTWKELIEIEEIPNRKQDVASVMILEEYGVLVAWQENLINGGYRIYRMNERQENKRLVLELTSSSYGLTGIWSFDIYPDTNDTQLIISEESTLTDPKIRGWRVFFGREHDLLVWIKYIRVGLTQSLLTTP